MHQQNESKSIRNEYLKIPNEQKKKKNNVLIKLFVRIQWDSILWTVTVVCMFVKKVAAKSWFVFHVAFVSFSSRFVCCHRQIHQHLLLMWQKTVDIVTLWHCTTTCSWIAALLFARAFNEIELNCTNVGVLVCVQKKRMEKCCVHSRTYVSGKGKFKQKLTPSHSLTLSTNYENISISF